MLLASNAQWGYIAASSQTVATVVLPIAFTETDYPIVTGISSGSYENYYNVSLQSKNTAQFTVSVPSKGSNYYRGWYWIAIGQ